MPTAAPTDVNLPLRDRQPKTAQFEDINNLLPDMRSGKVGHGNGTRAYCTQDSPSNGGRESVVGNPSGGRGPKRLAGDTTPRARDTRGGTMEKSYRAGARLLFKTWGVQAGTHPWRVGGNPPRGGKGS